MTSVEQLVQRGIKEKLISFAEWQRSLRSIRETGAGLESNKGNNAELRGCNESSGEPLWSMLIYLFVVDANGRSASVTGCCRVAGVSRSECLEHVEVLVGKELVIRLDEIDAENPNLILSSKGRQIVEDAIRNFIAARPDEMTAGASTPIEDSHLNERIAREMNISLEAVERHRANMAMTSD